MRISPVKHQTYFTLLIGLLLLCLLAACGSNTSGSSTTASTNPAATQAVVVPAMATETSLLPIMTLVGQPTAKLVSGHHTFEVDGKIKNGDTKQHDIYVQVVLLNASGAIIGSTAFFNVDNVPGSGTASYGVADATGTPSCRRRPDRT